MPSSFIIDHPDAGTRTAIHIAQCIGALQIEVDTGMRHSRGSVLKVCHGQGYTTKLTKKAALIDLHQIYTELTGRVYGS